MPDPQQLRRMHRRFPVRVVRHGSEVSRGLRQRQCVRLLLFLRQGETDQPRRLQHEVPSRTLWQLQKLHPVHPRSRLRLVRSCTPARRHARSRRLLHGGWAFWASVRSVIVGFLQLRGLCIRLPGIAELHYVQQRQPLSMGTGLRQHKRRVPVLQVSAEVEARRNHLPAVRGLCGPVWAIVRRRAARQQLQRVRVHPRLRLVRHLHSGQRKRSIRPRRLLPGPLCALVVSCVRVQCAASHCRRTVRDPGDMCGVYGHEGVWVLLRHVDVCPWRQGRAEWRELCAVGAAWVD
mmetsp:Transcript_9909/g.22785  ORF Transcript_9909/g.22785 Transcript_9909/m.22785 type:complete len:291 (-) Transcript_9909:664-1536(-)